jgi:protoporphyrin/coproporphyrin ferrochelatase
MSEPYQALLFLSFGGPEAPDDVIPFLENVLRGKNVPRERMLTVAEHYYHFGGKSPINDQNRALIAALEKELATHGLNLPIYWGNRNWHPLLTDTLRQMKADGVTRALAFFTSAFSSYSGCRQYRENILDAQTQLGPGAPEINKLRMYYNHPGFMEPIADFVKQALTQIPASRHAQCRVLFTAHSIPNTMAANSRYELQLREASRLVAELAGVAAEQYQLVYQSRSGPPTQPWLEPDILDSIKQLHTQGITDLIIVPIGFISDHMEVLYDLDTEAHDLCQQLSINMIRVPTIGTHPKFVSMIRELIVERMTDSKNKACLGQMGPSHDVCPVNCCLSGIIPGSRPAGVGSSPATGGRPASTTK